MRLRAIALVCALSVLGSARAEAASDACTPPRMQVGKWHGIEPMGGMQILLPPSFGSHATYSQSHRVAFYFADRDRIISLGAGPGPGVQLGPEQSMGVTESREKLTDGLASQTSTVVVRQMTQTAQCTTAINNRTVQIVEYRWYGADAVLSTSREEVGLYRLVAHYLPTDSAPEAFVSIEANRQSQIDEDRQIFWTATFEHQTAAPVAAWCVAKPDASLPSPGAVLDTALVQSLLASGGTPPNGFAVLTLSFNGGALAGIAVSQSDLPDSTQRQLATLIASNLAPHDARSPSSFLLRVELANASIGYAVQPRCGP